MKDDPAEPVWIPRQIIEAVQLDQLRAHGGRHGLLDRGLLDSALARPLQRWSLDGETDRFRLAASYGFGLVMIHPFVDGNKRIGFLAMVVFLGLNGFKLQTTNEDVVLTLFALAAGPLSEEALADWLRARCVPSA